MESITRGSYAREIGLISDAGEISIRALADLLRLPLARWGLSARMKVLGYARTQLEAAGLRDQASGKLAKVLRQMVRLKECVAVHIDGEPYIAPGQPQWIRSGYESATLLGVDPVPHGVVEQFPDGWRKDIVRRIFVRDDQEQADLHLAGVRETSVEEWLRPNEYLLHAMRREARLIRSDELSLAQFWELLVSAVHKEGLPLGSDAEVRLVYGDPGGYFGRHFSETCEGRWTDTAVDGIWCAYRQGYNQAHWHPIIVAIDGGNLRALDLYDTDEWRWALLARGKSTGVEERVESRNGVVQLTFPAPDQFVAVMDLLGQGRSGWSWRMNDGALDPWSMLG